MSPRLTFQQSQAWTNSCAPAQSPGHPAPSPVHPYAAGACMRACAHTHAHRRTRCLAPTVKVTPVDQTFSPEIPDRAHESWIPSPQCPSPQLLSYTGRELGDSFLTLCERGQFPPSPGTSVPVYKVKEGAQETARTPTSLPSRPLRFDVDRQLLLCNWADAPRACLCV